MNVICTVFWTIFESCCFLLHLGSDAALPGYRLSTASIYTLVFDFDIVCFELMSFGPRCCGLLIAATTLAAWKCNQVGLCAIVCCYRKLSRLSADGVCIAAFLLTSVAVCHAGTIYLFRFCSVTVTWKPKVEGYPRKFVMWSSWRNAKHCQKSILKLSSVTLYTRDILW